MYTIAKIKTFIGNEGQGLNAVLVKDGKPVAFVLDDANGGELQVDFTNPEQNAKSYQAHRSSAKKAEADCIAHAREWWNNSPNAEESRKFFKQLNEDYPESARATQSDWNCLRAWIDHEVDAALMKRSLDRMSKTKTLFRLNDEIYAEGEYRAVKAPYSEAVRAQLDKKYGKRIMMIYGVTL